MWPLKTILYFVLFWVACLMSLVNPIWGLVNYMMVYQIHPKSTWWGMPLAQMGMRFSLLAAIFTVLGILFARKRVPKIRPMFSHWEAAAVALVLIGAVNLMFGSRYHAGSAYAFEKLWKMLFFVLILGRLATTRFNLKIVIWTLVAGSLYVGYDAFTAHPSSFWEGRLELIGGPDFATTSGTGAHMAAMLPIIGVGFLIARKWRWRILAALSGALALNTIILCRTRSAFVGLLCGAAVAVLAAPRARRYRLRVLIVGGAVLAFALTDNYFWNRMATLTDREALAKDTAFVGRAEIWRASLQLLAERPFGIGPGNFAHAIGTYDPRHYSRSAHNTFIVCFTELGVQGGIIFVLMLLGSLRFLYLSTRLADDTDDPLETKLIAYGLLIALVTYVIAGLGTERFYCESFWWILVLPMCLYRTVVREVVACDTVPELAQRDGEFTGVAAPA